MYWVGDTIGTVLAVYSYEYLFKQNTTTEEADTIKMKQQQDIENVNSNGGNIVELQQNTTMNEEFVVHNKIAS